MTHAQMLRFLKDRRKLQTLQSALNARVKEASAGRAHTQGCPVGGLITGLGADCSGAMCWCGAQGDSNGQGAP